MAAGDQWVLELDPVKTAFMLLAHRAAGERDAGIAAMHMLISNHDIDQVAYALGAAFAELARPNRDRSQPFTNLADYDQLNSEVGLIANTTIAAAANRHRHR